MNFIYYLHRYGTECNAWQAHFTWNILKPQFANWEFWTWSPKWRSASGWICLVNTVQREGRLLLGNQISPLASFEGYGYLRNHFNIKKRRYWHCRTQILDVWDMLVWGALLRKHEFHILLASLRHWMQCLAGTCYLKHLKTSVCKLRILGDLLLDRSAWSAKWGRFNFAGGAAEDSTESSVLHPQWITPPSLGEFQQTPCNLPKGHPKYQYERISFLNCSRVYVGHSHDPYCQLRMIMDSGRKGTLAYLFETRVPWAMAICATIKTRYISYII